MENVAFSAELIRLLCFFLLYFETDILIGNIFLKVRFLEVHDTIDAKGTIYEII